MRERASELDQSRCSRAKRGPEVLARRDESCEKPQDEEGAISSGDEGVVAAVVDEVLRREGRPRVVAPPRTRTEEIVRHPSRARPVECASPSCVAINDQARQRLQPMGVVKVGRDEEECSDGRAQFEWIESSNLGEQSRAIAVRCHRAMLSRRTDVGPCTRTSSVHHDENWTSSRREVDISNLTLHSSAEPTKLKIASPSRTDPSSM